MLMCIPFPQPTMSSEEAHPTPFNRSFTVQEFDKFLTSALDIDRVPLPLINFAPSRSSPASLEWTASLDSYVDDQHDIDALEQPFLNLDGLSIDLGKPQPTPTLLRKVKSRATALVRRGKDDSHLPPVTEIDYEDFVDDPPPPVRVRTKSLPLSAFGSRKSKDLPSSVEPHVRRPCRSFIEDSVPQHHFWRRTLALPSPSISLGPHRAPRLGESIRSSPSSSLAHGGTESSSLQLEDPDSQPTSAPFLNPRTPPMPISGLPLYEPSQSYLGTRRGSTTSTNSSLSSVSIVEFWPRSLIHACPGTAPSFRQVERGFIRIAHNVISVTVGPTFKIKGLPHLGYRNRVRGFSSLHCNYLLFPPNPLIPLHSYPLVESRVSGPPIQFPRSDHGTKRF